MPDNKKQTLGLLVLLAALGLCAQPADARFDLPQDAYRIAELRSAIKEAANEKWPVTFFLSDEKTTCKFCVQGSLDILRELGEDSIIVYVTPEQISGLPPLAVEALSSSRAGRVLPIAAVADPCMATIIDIVPYSKDQQKHLEFLREAHSAMLDKDALACSKKKVPKKFLFAGAACIMVFGFFIFKRK